jgi:acyl carrier protein
MPRASDRSVLSAKRTIVRLLAEGRAEGPLPADDTPLAALVVDSFALVEMAFRLQNELPVSLSQSDLATTRTLGDLATLIAERSGPR